MIRFQQPAALDGWSFLGSTLGHLAFLGLVFFTPPALDGLTLDPLGPSDRFLELVVRPPRARDDVPDWFPQRGPDPRSAERVARGDRREPGALGRKDAPNPRRRASRRGPPEGDRVDAEVRRRVQSLRIFEVLNGAGALTTVGADSVNLEPSGPVDAAGHPFGLVIGASRGTGGVAADGPGGGGRLAASVDLPGLMGRIGVEREPRGVCRGASCEHGTRTPERPPPAPEEGRLERAMVARVIGRHRLQMRSCYEQELQHRRDLAGRVLVRFVISPGGRVVSARIGESSLGSAAVESCLVERVRRLRFPARLGGSVVEVSYPFLFRAVP